MNLVDSNKKILNDFEERKESDLSNVYYYKGYEYITVHPTSDETEILTKLGLNSTDCIKVDLYWRVENRVFFLQVNSNNFLNDERKGLFARWESRNSRVYLEANLEVSFISRQVIERVMDAFLTKGIISMNFSEDNSFKKYVYLGDLTCED
jgi:hypothetical protein